MSSQAGGANWDWLTQAQVLRQKGKAFALVTVISQKGSTPRDVGAKLLVEQGGAFYGTIGGGRLEKLVLEDVQKILLYAVTATKSYPLCFKTNQCCGGAVEILIEVMGRGPQLFLFGAGHVAQAVCQVLVGTPFQVHLIDERSEWVCHPDLPSEVICHQSGWQDFINKAAWDQHYTYVAVVTHDHQIDLDVISAVLKQPAKFIGLIGSDTKWDRFQQRLLAAGYNVDLLSRVHCPIGLAIGGKAPREVAISIASQLLRIHYES